MWPSRAPWRCWGLQGWAGKKGGRQVSELGKSEPLDDLLVFAARIIRGSLVSWWVMGSEQSVRLGGRCCVSCGGSSHAVSAKEGQFSRHWGWRQQGPAVLWAQFPGYNSDCIEGLTWGERDVTRPRRAGRKGRVKDGYGAAPGGS